MFKFFEYSEDIATNLRDIGHTTKKPRFFKSTGLASLDGIVANLATVNFPCMVAEDGKDQRMEDNDSDNPMYRPFYTWFFLYQASISNDKEIMEARDKAMETARKAVSRIYSDHINAANGLELLQPNTINFQGVGPLGDLGHGVMVTFTLRQEAMPFNPNDWLDF
jgi:hypothetical protein